MRVILVSGVMMIPLLCGVPVARHYVQGAARPQSARPVAPRPETCVVCAAGVVESDCREISLQFERSGRIESLSVREGDVVRQGDVLAVLDSAVAKQELAQAEAGLSLAQAEKQRLLNGVRPETLAVIRAEMKVAEVAVTHAERNYRRSLQLSQRNAVPEQEADDRRAQFESAQAELAAIAARYAEQAGAARADEVQMADARIALAQAKVRAAKEALEQCVLRAPRDGAVSQVECEIGELVVVEAARHAITLVGATPRRVRTFVEELDAIRVQPGMVATITADGMPGAQVKGRVLTCAPAMTEKSLATHRANERQDTKVREVLVELEPQDSAASLVIGLPVDVRLDLCQDVDSLR